jgi:hypothetical protein
MLSQVIGSVGVAVLLIAFVLNMTRRLSEEHPLYLGMNFVGAGLAGWFAFDSGIIPFVILEIVWAGSALFKLLLVIKKGSQSV